MSKLVEPKAIFLDMDGTILDHYNRVSVNTKEVINKLRAKGIPVFIATGRSREEIFPLVPEGFAVDGIISSNGMTVYLGEEKIEEHSLPYELVKEIIEKARVNQVYYELFPAVGERIVLKQDQRILQKEVQDPQPDSVGINEWLSRKEAMEGDISWVDLVPEQTYSKFYCFSRSVNHINEWKKVLDEIKEQVDFTTSSSSEHNVEVMVANVNKATSIQIILEQLNIVPEEILVMGDSHNDIPMFELAGQTVAMKNAALDIQEMVDEVTAYTCDDDGVYHYLMNRFFS
ncbi:haloacid dehalogenase [Paraliobacillus quinghaiensis]|uniref:Haloacid dehalogenase n=1 Tax=Paraliobacillus quinghaiensis TaxID=470815 RepID=A0A917TQK8_9BACI|nr:HAD family hydrolase [Paraliobacillus quinghaiensis]GGM33466.1 haloacid dehalogenase [Paraliobacillus quinghaiensis]